jgi:hypothetical protein
MLPSPVPRLLLTVLPRPRYSPIPQEPFNVRNDKQVLGELDLDSLGAVELRCEILRRTTVRKTANPHIRSVEYFGIEVGRIAKSPFTFNTWIASTDRRTPYSSIADASITVVMDHLRGGAA